jgi:hypothetical protein
MPDDFIGLSYESEQLVDPDFFSPDNHDLIRQFRAITPHGVLRLGGNTAEYSYWKPTPDAAEPGHPPTREVPGEPRAQFYPVTPHALHNLAGFLKAAGWQCIYGINLGTNTPDRAAKEAEFVAHVLSKRLQYFQMGNEPDLFGSHLRDPATWSEKPYLDEWLALAGAILTRVPHARFGLPDIGGDSRWIPQIAAAWPALANRPAVTALTHHYYYDGPATNPVVTIPHILSASTMAAVQRTADHVTAAANAMHVAVRMTEGNTCYGGGKPGVSDVFAAALWAADYTLLLASNGYAGVNLHGGSGKSVANSLGGELSGDVLLRREGAMPAEMAAHPRPFYSPIATLGSAYRLEPVAYGLIFAGALRNAAIITSDFTRQLQVSGVNASAYAARHHDGTRSVVVINKDLAADVTIELDFGSGVKGHVGIETLHAAAIDSRDTALSNHPTGKLHAGRYSLVVPHASAVRVTVT